MIKSLGADVKTTDAGAKIFFAGTKPLAVYTCRRELYIHRHLLFTSLIIISRTLAFCSQVRAFWMGASHIFFGQFAFKLKIRYFLPLRFPPLFGNDGH